MNNCGFNFEPTYTTLPKLFFTETSPTPVSSPSVVILNHELVKSIGLDFSDLTKKEQAALFSGNTLPEEATPLSLAYAGHQFGHFNILGDGRAHLLGEHITPKGNRFDVQFKGSGQTPYSRTGDGRAALAPMLREYIISEAMHHLGIPTTRSLAVVTTGQPVIREAPLTGAVLTRVASSHIRVGTFEFAAAQKDNNAIQSLLEYTIWRHYPELKNAQNKALALINAVIDRQTDLMTHWLRVGFIHGVMNTDNMTLSGETIDYGPCAFMDSYHPATVFSSIDQNGRYAYGNQPHIALWNITRLAETLLPLIDDDLKKAVTLAEESLSHFQEIFQRKWLLMMQSKLGLLNTLEGDETLINDLLNWMSNSQADYTLTFTHLSYHTPRNGIYKQSSFQDWHNRWQQRLNRNSAPLPLAYQRMRNNNPVIIPRNHHVEHALQAADKQDLTPLTDLLAALKAPYQDTPSQRDYQAAPTPAQRIYQTFCGT